MPVEERRARPAQYSDIEALPEHVIGEILEGELFTSPRPRLRHASAATRLARRIGSGFEDGTGGPGGWIVLAEPELHLAENVLVPDLAAWRRERLPEVPDLPWLELAPDWLCEVISPATEGTDRGKKLRIYARARVGHVWLLNPASRSLEVLRLEGDLWVLAGVHVDVEVVRPEPFAAVELDLSRLWSAAPPSSG